MRAAVALSLTLSMLAGGCFPNNAKHRTIAKVVEGGLAIGGVVLLATVNTSADCMGVTSGDVDQDCEDKAKLLSTMGLGMILTGLLGFIVTVSTAPDDDKPETKVTTAPTPSTTTETAPAPANTAPATPAAPTEPTPPTPPTPPTNPETPPGATPPTPPAPETPAS